MSLLRYALVKRLICKINSGFLIAAIIATLVFGCKKNSSLPSASSSHAALLIKEVDIARNSENVVFDSTVTTYQYDNNKNVTEIQRTDNSLISGYSISSSQTWAFTYTGNLISGSAESFTNQTSATGVPSSTSSGQTINIFYASGNKISYYKGITTETANSFGITINSIVYDSAEFGYNGNNISSYILYQKEQTSNVYSQLYNNTYSYQGSNLTGFVDIVTASGVDTTTGTYSYDNKTSYLPINYIVPGVYFYTPNNVTQLTQVTKGGTPLQQTYTYQWTYNSNDQPSACKATIATNPPNYDNGAIVSSSYYYQ